MLTSETKDKKPSIHELGLELLNLSKLQLFMTILQPFAFFILYFIFAFHEYYIPAFFCTLGLSFTTYGSTSHDLVHMNLKINRYVNDLLLFFLELICLRSGHAYRLSHLNHHHLFPDEKDIEGAASKMTIFGTFIEGIIFQFKIYFWALKHYKNRSELNWIIVEGIFIVLIIALSIFSLHYTFVFLAYIILMIAGSWIIPFTTSYLVHKPEGKDELHQTRLFRGKFYHYLSFGHLYHLEHHMYPMVPHKNWVLLSKKLDNYFQQNNIVPEILPKK
jgi:beta-carotene hydroxylase